MTDSLCNISIWSEVCLMMCAVTRITNTSRKFAVSPVCAASIQNQRTKCSLVQLLTLQCSPIVPILCPLIAQWQTTEGWFVLEWNLKVSQPGDRSSVIQTWVLWFLATLLHLWNIMAATMHASKSLHVPTYGHVYWAAKKARY